MELLYAGIGFITIDEMLFVTNNLGFNFTKPEV